MASESGAAQTAVDNGKLMLHLKVGSDAKHVTKQINSTEKLDCLRMQWVTEKKRPLLRLVV